MSTSIRAVITRPSTSVQWPSHEFVFVTQSNYVSLDATGKVQTFVKGDIENDLEIIADHFVADDAYFDTHKVQIHAHIPIWKDSTNAAEVDDYVSKHGITVTLSDVKNPDLTGFTPIAVLSPVDFPADYIAGTGPSGL